MAPTLSVFALLNSKKAKITACLEEKCFFHSSQSCLLLTNNVLRMSLKAEKHPFVLLKNILITLGTVDSTASKKPIQPVHLCLK